MDEHGYGTIVAPGNDPYVITVGAMNDMGTTSRARRPDRQLQLQGPHRDRSHLVKPGPDCSGNGTVSLLSPNSTLAVSANLVPNSYYQTGGTGTSSSYFRLSGTSMATPYVRRRGAASSAEPFADA